MMLDGALRFGQQARQLWVDSSQANEVDRLVRRMLDVVEELVRSVAGGRVEAATRLEEEYAFIFRQVSAVALDHDVTALDSALRLLAYQRETWRQACEKVKAPAASVSPLTHLSHESSPTAGFSFQA